MDIVPSHDNRYVPKSFLVLSVTRLLLLRTDKRENTATGWFLLLTSMIGYFRVKRFEMSVRASRTVPASLSTEDIQRDVAFRRNLEDVFGINVVFDSETAATAANLAPSQSPDEMRRTRVFRAIEEARLQNDLRSAGLL